MAGWSITDGDLYVDGVNGNDTTGNGSMDSPFLTIQAAINESNTLSISTPVVIYIHPGRYTENITITKPLTSIVGMTSTFSNGCQINGNVTITPSDDSLGVFNNLFSIENLLITGRTGSASVVTFSGVKTGYLNINNCKIYKVTSLNNPELVYYGHTCQTLAQRFSTHKSKSNKSRSKQIIELGDAVILLVTIRDYLVWLEDSHRNNLVRVALHCCVLICRS